MKRVKLLLQTFVVLQKAYSFEQKVKSKLKLKRSNSYPCAHSVCVYNCLNNTDMQSLR